MCDFNASALLELRREISANKILTTEAIKGVIDEIDRRRWDHLDQTGCDCWQKAREASWNPARSKEEEAA